MGREKLDFYAAQELLIVDPADHSISWLVLQGDRYQPTTHSRLLDLSTDEVAKQLIWPS